MFGGNVSYTSNVAEPVAVVGRIASAGTVTAPVRVPRFTVTSGGTGIYNIVFSEQFVQFLGCQICPELAAVPGGVATCIDVAYNWTAASRTLQVLCYNNAATPAGVATAFSFVAQFADSNGP